MLLCYVLTLYTCLIMFLYFLFVVYMLLCYKTITYNNICLMLYYKMGFFQWLNNKIKYYVILYMGKINFRINIFYVQSLMYLSFLISY